MDDYSLSVRAKEMIVRIDEGVAYQSKHEAITGRTFAILGALPILGAYGIATTLATSGIAFTASAILLTGGLASLALAVYFVYMSFMHRSFFLNTVDYYLALHEIVKGNYPGAFAHLKEYAGKNDYIDDELVEKKVTKSLYSVYGIKDGISRYYAIGLLLNLREDILKHKNIDAKEGKRLIAIAQEELTGPNLDEYNLIKALDTNLNKAFNGDLTDLKNMNIS